MFVRFLCGVVHIVSVKCFCNLYVHVLYSMFNVSDNSRLDDPP